MRTRSSGPAKDPITGEIFLDSPQSTIPAFTHEPIPFNPFPEAAFPTLEFPVPKPSERHERARRIARSNRGGLPTPGRDGSPGALTRSQSGVKGEIRITQGVLQGAIPQLEENASTSDETLQDEENQPEEVDKWTATDQPGRFQNNPFWTDDNELHSQLPTMEKTYAVIPTWSDLTPGVHIAIMAEMVDTYGIDNTPKLLELTPEEINKYVDLQESEVRAQAAEEERTRQYNDHRFGEMLAGKIDGSNSIELLDLQFSQGSIWEPATFAMKAVDLKAGGRFLLSLGFKDQSETLWMYHGIDAIIGCDFRPPVPTATKDFQEVESPKMEPTINIVDDKITGQPDESEDLGIKVERRRQSVPKATRNLLLEKVKKPKKSRPPKKQQPAGSEPYSPAHTPSKLRMSISVDEILSDEQSDAEEAGPLKARVARQVKPGTDLSKAVKYTKPARQWADVPNTRCVSKEQHMRKQRSRTAQEKLPDYVDLTECEPDSPVTPEKQTDQNGTYLQPPSENAWFAPTRGRLRMTAARAMMSETLADTDYPSLPVVKNVAGFANPGLAAKWAKKSNPTDKAKSDEAAKGPGPRLPLKLDFERNGSNSLKGKELSASTPPQHLDETQRPKRKTVTTDELLSPFDASTPGRATRAQKWKEGTAVRTGQLSVQEQYVADENVPIEMLNAGEQILMTRPRVATRTTRKNNGSAATGEGRTGKGEGTIGGAVKRFSIPRRLMRDPENEDE